MRQRNHQVRSEVSAGPRVGVNASSMSDLTQSVYVESSVRTWAATVQGVNGDVILILAVVPTTILLFGMTAPVRERFEMNRSVGVGADIELRSHTQCAGEERDHQDDGNQSHWHGNSAILAQAPTSEQAAIPGVL